MKYFLLMSVACLLLYPAAGLSAPIVKGSVSGDNISRVVIAQKSGNESAVLSSKSKFSIKGSTKGNRLSVLGKDGRIAGPVVYGIKNGKKVLSVSAARDKGLCNSSSKAVMSVKQSSRDRKRKKRTVNVRRVVHEPENSFAYARTIRKSSVDARSSELSSVDSNCAPEGSRLGLSNSPQGLSLRLSGDTDGDGTDDAHDLDDDNDGMIDAFDIDDDGDGVLDNDDPDFDSSNPDEGDLANSRFHVFSNFHLDFENTVNVNAFPLDSSLIDQRLSGSAGLAFQVYGGDQFDVELDYGPLSYCSSGGSGQTLEPHPNGLKFPEALDSDEDGFGTIAPGPTGDFQLRTNATSTELQAGDVYFQRFTDADGKESEVPGMLNFIFHTVPAVRQVATDTHTYDIVYPVSSGDPGTPGNCFEVPSSGDVKVTFTVWRPQRPGVSGVETSAFIDMGNLKLSANIPNAPCVAGTNGVCSDTPGTGPGLCAGSLFATSDPNLMITNDGLQDSKGDVPSDPSNTFTFTLELSRCFSDAGISWDSGEAVSYPLQMANSFGDNAVQNLCFVRQ